jgi:hypothetical protein
MQSGVNDFRKGGRGIIMNTCTCPMAAGIISLHLHFLSSPSPHILTVPRKEDALLHVVEWASRITLPVCYGVPALPPLAWNRVAVKGARVFPRTIKWCEISTIGRAYDDEC